MNKEDVTVRDGQRVLLSFDAWNIDERTEHYVFRCGEAPNPFPLRSRRCYQLSFQKNQLDIRMRYLRRDRPSRAGSFCYFAMAEPSLFETMEFREAQSGDV
ncbi:MAG: hypothetical protein HYY96_04220 [Candidatus Tectomicrobia bacterium]|nr:hypothetical protein [Candidatus Tectomicrobia bacterium]